MIRVLRGLERVSSLEKISWYLFVVDFQVQMRIYLSGHSRKERSVDDPFNKSSAA